MASNLPDSFEVTVPPELWLIIAKVIEPNPLVYINLSRVCRSSRTVFQSDKLWRKLVPYGDSVGHYYSFQKHMKRKNRSLIRRIRNNWRQVLEITCSMGSSPALPEFSGALDDPDLALSLCLNESLIRKTKFGIAFWKCALLQNPLLFEYAPKQFYQSAPLLLYAIEEANCSPVFLENRAPVLENLEVATAAVERAPNILSKMSTGFIRENMHLLMRSIKLYPWVIIQDSVAEFRDIPQVAQAVVSQSGQLLGVLSNRMKGDYDIVYTAVSNYGASLQNAAENLRSNKQLVLAAVNNYGMALKYASESLKSDKEIVLAAVKNNGDARTLAHQSLQYDKDIVATALMAMRR